MRRLPLNSRHHAADPWPAVNPAACMSIRKISATTPKAATLAAQRTTSQPSRRAHSQDRAASPVNGSPHPL